MIGDYFFTIFHLAKPFLQYRLTESGEPIQSIDKDRSRFIIRKDIKQWNQFLQKQHMV